MRLRSSPRTGSGRWLKRRRLGDGSSTTTASSAAFSGGDLHGLATPDHHGSHQRMESKRKDEAGMWEQGIGQRLDDGGEIGVGTGDGERRRRKSRRRGGLNRGGGSESGTRAALPARRTRRAHGHGGQARLDGRCRGVARRRHASARPVPPRVNSVTLFRLLFNFSNYSQICVTT